MFRKFAALLPVTLMVIMMFISLALAAEADKIAIVNGTVITKDEYERELVRIRDQAARQGKEITEAEMPEIKKQIIDNIIETLVFYQDAIAKGIKADQAMADKEWAQLKSGYPDDKSFEKTLADKKITETLIMDQLQKRNIIKKFIDQNFTQKTVIPESEVKAYYDNNPEQFNKPESVRASHILIPADISADEKQKKEARDKVEKIQARVKAGEDFATLAKENSRDPVSSEKGGDLGFFTKGQMVKPVEDAAFALAPGAVSDIVETQYGYHIIKVTDKQPADKFSFDEVKSRLADYLKNIKISKDIGDYTKTLKEKAKIEIF